MNAHSVSLSLTREVKGLPFCLAGTQVQLIFCEIFANPVRPLCRDLSLCCHWGGSVSVYSFDKVLDFIANCFAVGDLLALHR